MRLFRRASPQPRQPQALDDYETRVKRHGLTGLLVYESRWWEVFAIAEKAGRVAGGRRIAASLITLRFPGTPTDDTHRAKGHIFVTEAHFTLVVHVSVQGDPAADFVRIESIPLTAIEMLGPSEHGSDILHVRWTRQDGTRADIAFTLSGWQGREGAFLLTWMEACKAIGGEGEYALTVMP